MPSIRSRSVRPSSSPPPSISPDGGSLEALLEFAQPATAANTLVIAEHALDILCALIRHGCPAAACLRPDAKPESPAYDLVIVRDLPAALGSDRLVHLARQALVPAGRIVVQLADHPGDRRVFALMRHLQMNGFTAIRTKSARTHVARATQHLRLSREWGSTLIGADYGTGMRH